MTAWQFILITMMGGGLVGLAIIFAVTLAIEAYDAYRENRSLYDE